MSDKGITLEGLAAAVDALRQELATWKALAHKQDALTAAQQAAVDSGATAAKIDQIASNASAIVSLTSSKQDTLSTTQLAAVNSGITAAAVQQIGTNADSISGLQTAVATKAADDAVVHLAGAETITGDKTFTGATATHNITPETSATYNLGDPTKWYKDTYTNTVWVQGVRAPGTSNTLILAAMETWEDGARMFMNGKDHPSGSAIYADVDHNDGVHSKTGFLLDSRGFLPTGVSRHLGLANPDYKWFTFNGINPGNLSIPNISSVVDISGSITSFDGTTIDLSSIITVPGWVNIVIPYVAGDYIRFSLGRTGSSTVFRNSRYIICGSHDSDFISVFAPVSTELVVQINIKASGGAVTQARFYPCLGNV